ncbi:MAG: hypothetical protein WCQ53_01545 [bacterium]
MLSILMSIIFSLNAYSEEPRCHMDIADINNQALSIVTLEESFAPDFMIKCIKTPSMEMEAISVSIETNSKNEKIINASVGSTPSKKIKDINEQYKNDIATLKTSGSTLKFIKKINITLEQSPTCSDQDIAVMLFFIEDWFYPKED